MNRGSGVPGGHLENYTHTLVSDPTNRVHVQLWGPATQVEEPQVGTRTSRTQISSRKEQRYTLGGKKVHVEQVYHTKYTSAHLRWLEQAR